MCVCVCVCVCVRACTCVLPSVHDLDMHIDLLGSISCVCSCSMLYECTHTKLNIEAYTVLQILFVLNYMCLQCYYAHYVDILLLTNRA